jgi:septum formation protein
VTPPQRIYLASRSPRRRELLQQIGVPFDTLLFRSGTRLDAEVDETPLPGEAPMAYVDRVARAKANCGIRLVQFRRLRSNLVLSADTTLEFEGGLIGKPADPPEASLILGRLSGKTHRVLTAVAVAAPDGRIEAMTSVSEVRFKPLSEEEVRRYVATGEPLDKAGAYGIQGHAGRFVEHLSGSYTGVMGLPLFEASELLARFGFKF